MNECNVASDDAARDVATRDENGEGDDNIHGGGVSKATTITTTSSSPPPLRQEELPWIFSRMPNTAFGIPMGLGGHAIVWKSAAKVMESTNNSNFNNFASTANIMNIIVWISSLVVLCIVGICYIYKLAYNFEYVQKEWRCPTRTHFMNGPHLTLLMLGIGIPQYITDIVGMTPTGLRIVWTTAFISQLVITQFMYEHWFFDEKQPPSPSTTTAVGSNHHPHHHGSSRRLSCARPQFLLSTVGWFLLSVLGSICRLNEVWGINLPAFCLGAGSMLYMMVIMNIFNDHNASNSKENVIKRGSPALFLLIAPPSVAVVAIDMLTVEAYDDGQQESSFSIVSQIILGWCLLIVILLIRLGPIITKRPPVLGIYWAYVFPSSALASALLRYASVTDTGSSYILAVVFVILSFLALIIVFCRTIYHCIKCMMVKDESWGDPLLSS